MSRFAGIVFSLLVFLFHLSWATIGYSLEDIPESKEYIYEGSDTRHQDSVNSFQKAESLKFNLETLFRKVRLERNANECIVLMVQTGECPISVEYFNQFVPAYVSDDSSIWEKDTIAASRSVRRNILDYLSGELFKLSGDDEFHAAAKKKLDATIGGNGKKTFEKSAIFREYFMQFAHYFGDYRFEYFGSSDSGFIRELYSKIIETNGHRGINSSIPSICFESKKKCWAPQSLIGKRVPVDWWNRSFYLSTSVWSAPKKESFGYSLLRFMGEIYYTEEIRSVLAVLEKLVGESSGRVWKKEARAYYNENIQDFRHEDSVVLNIRILPKRAMRMRGVDEGEPEEMDSLLIPWRKVGLSNMPSQVQARIKTCVGDRSRCDGNKFFEYGKSWIVIGDVVAKEGVIPFKDVEDFVVKTMKLRVVDSVCRETKKIVDDKYKSKIGDLAFALRLNRFVERVEESEIQAFKNAFSNYGASSGINRKIQVVSSDVHNDDIRKILAAQKAENAKQAWIAENLKVLLDL